MKAGEKMDLETFLERYIFNRDAVFENREALNTLGDFGTLPHEMISVLRSGAKRLNRQLNGRSAVLLLNVGDETSSGYLSVLEADGPLNGMDADIVSDRLLPRGRGLLWRRVGSGETQLIASNLEDQRDYIELLTTTKAVFNIPVNIGGETRVVLSVESSDPMDFVDARRKAMIVNYAELLLVAQLNSERQRAREECLRLSELVSQLRALQDRQEDLRANLALGPPLAWRILALLDANQSLSVEVVTGEFGGDLSVFETVCRLVLARFVAFSEGSLSLTDRGASFLQDIGLRDIEN